MKKYQTIREAIKKLSEAQKNYKPQRKTVHFHGKRTVTPEVACNHVESNRISLRHLYHAYAKIKGFELPKPKRKYFSEKLVDTLVKKYTQEPLEKVA